ncbi:MAG TPA: molybdopterin biosynthesis protein, partial [Anaerolineaceae bacterium]|nr:molybdopterin biosynthesis protein [Anaerolineaceae bacterium]
MSVYLQDIPLDQAKQRFAEALTAAGLGGVLGVEEIPVDENAVGRVTAQAVFARLSSPHYHASAMDGFAVRAEEIAGAMPTRPETLSADGQTAVYLDTGDPLPEWADTVIPIEQVEPLDERDQPAADPRRPARIRVRLALPPWS